LLIKLSPSESNLGFKISGSEASTLEVQANPDLAKVVLPQKVSARKLLTRQEVFRDV